jgi:hypothetical protein
LHALAAHNNCLNFLLVFGAASQFSSKKNNMERFARGDTDMLDAIQISLALWGMIVCAAIKATQLMQYLS